jgi:hypothetical protein
MTVTVTNPPAPLSVIVSNGSSWRYFTAANEPPAQGANAWYATDYDASSWASGFAELGGGDAVAPGNTVPERTVIDLGPGADRYHAAYFRHEFSVADGAAINNLSVHSLHDDGSAVYLNGTLVATFNMTNEVGVPITYADFAGGAVGHDGSLFVVSNITAQLVTGRNVLAVEVHQNNNTSSDLSFDLMLWGESTTAPGPKLVITSGPAPNQITITWPPASGTLMQCPVVSGGTWTPAAVTVDGTFTTTTTGAQMFYRLEQ